MKKVFKTMAFTLLGLVLSMNLMAATAYKTLTFPDNNSNKNRISGYTATWTAKMSTDEWSIVNFNNNSWNNSWTYIKAGAKKSKSGDAAKVSTASISTAFAIDKAIDKIIVTGSLANSNTITASSLTIADNKEFTSNPIVIDNCPKTFTDGVIAFSISGANLPAQNKYYKIEFTISNNTTNNGGMTVSQVEYFEAQETPAGTVAAPTFTPATGKDFYPTLSVTLAQKDSKTIYYTTNTEYTSNEEVFANGTEYSSAINLEATTTIQAVAIDGDNISDIANATYTKVTPLSMENLLTKTIENGTTEKEWWVNVDGWVITGVSGNEVYASIQGSLMGILIYSSNHGFNVGDHLSGAVKVKSKTYYNKPEITNLTSNTDGLTIEEGENLTPIKLTTFEDIDQTSQGALISVENIQYLSEYNDFEFNDEDYINLGDKFYDAGELTDGRYYNVTGIVYFRYDNGYYFYIGPRNGDDITLKQATEYNITINPSSNGSVSVQDDKTQAAEGESVTLSIEPAENYKLATLIVDGTDVAASVEDNKYTFSMPNHVVTISATFAAKDVYTITWKVKGQADATTEVVEGETLSLPTAPTFEGYKFIGWTASAIDGKQSTPPTLLANNTTPTAHATYYAVFAVVTGQDPMVGNYTLNYDPDVKDESLGYDNAVNVTAADGSEWVVKAYKQNGMQINTGKGAYIKVPNCPANISSINITTTSTAKKAVKFAETTDGDALATGSESTSQTLDLSSKSVKSGYILPTGNVQITKVVVNYSGTKDHLDNYTTNPTAQVKVKFDLNGGTGTFNDASIDEGDDYTVTFETPIAPEGYEFDGWMYNETKYVGGNKIENITSDITLTAQYKKAWYGVGKASMENGTINISADPALNENTAEYGATVTLTPAPNTNYAFESIDAYKADDDETKVTLTPAGDNYTFTMPAYAVEVSATFIAAASSCDINFYAAGNTTTPMKTISKKRGEKYEITEVGTAVDGFTFVGWATATQDAEVETPITTVSSVTPPMDSEDPINLYAVYKRAAVEAAYEKVTEEPTSWEGDYLLSYSEKVFAVGKTGGEEGIGKSDVKVDLSEKIVNDKIASADGDEYKVIIEACTNGYLLKTQDGLYNYQTSNANGITTGNKESATTYPITISLNEGGTVHMGLDNGAKFQYNTGGYFRFYKSTSSMKELTLYKLGEASYKYTTSPIVKYTISYDLNGGTVGDGNFAAQEVVKGETATLTTSIPVAPTGYEFDGWYNGDVKVGATIENVQNNIELVAHYNILSYAVTIPVVDNGTIEVTTLAEGKAEYNAELTITLTPAANYEVVPNSLKVYETGNEENVVSVTENKFAMPAFPVTVAAAFQAVTPNFTITVQSANTEQGTVSISEETETTLSLKEGDERTILAWPNEGYRFVNWTTEDDITIADADDDETTFTVKTSGATITANFEAIPSVTYTKITTTDDLAYNDKVIIVAATANMAMSATQNTNNRSEVAITRGDAGATITLATDEVAVLDVLSGNAAQTFAFHDANGYLYAASSSSNHMKSEDELDDNGNGNWNVTISEGSATIIAQGENSRKWMLYNKNSSLFSCYQTTTDLGTTYQYVSLYRIVSDDQVLVTLMNGEEVFARYRATKNSSITLNGFAPTIEGKVVLGWTDGETVYAADDEVAVAETNITLNIKVCDFVLEGKTANAYATICLPRKIDHVENATLFHISHGNINKVEFEEVTDFSEEPAGMPYLVQVIEDGSVQFFCDENVTTTEPVSREGANGFVGSLQEAKQEVPNNGMSLLVSGGQLHLALDGCYLTQYHAYIDVYNVPASPNKAPNMAARRVTLYNAEAQTPTNLNGLNGNMKAQKVMKDGQFYIIREAKMYNAQGIEVQ